MGLALTDLDLPYQLSYPPVLSSSTRTSMYLKSSEHGAKRRILMPRVSEPISCHVIATQPLIAFPLTRIAQYPRLAFLSKMPKPLQGSYPMQTQLVSTLDSAPLNSLGSREGETTTKGQPAIACQIPAEILLMIAREAHVAQLYVDPLLSDVHLNSQSADEGFSYGDPTSLLLNMSQVFQSWRD